MPHSGILSCSVKTAARKKTATKPTAPQESDSESEEEMSEDPEESESGGPDSDVESSASAPKKRSPLGKLLTVSRKSVSINITLLIACCMFSFH